MFLYETHLHSSACSACAVSTSEEMVLEAKEKGLAGLIFTNHFYHGNTAVDRSLDWEDFVDVYEKDFLAAKKLGDQIGINVLFGLEEGYGRGKEFLIYGVSPAKIKNCLYFKHLSMEEIHQFVHSCGGITVCAHPYRNRFYIPNPNQDPNPYYFDGIEVFNLENSEEENEKANIFAENHKKIKFSGGDVHTSSNLGFAGLLFEEEIKTDEQLINAVLSGNYNLFKKEKDNG